MRRFLTFAASALLVAVTLQAEPAVAQRRAFDDLAGDADRGVDIRKVQVINGRRILVGTQFDFLGRRTVKNFAIAYDTRAGDAGPEFAASGFFGPVGEWHVLRIEGWKDTTPQPVDDCESNMRVRFGKSGVVTYNVSRECLDHPGNIRVAAVASEEDSGSQDWAPRRNHFYAWVQHGAG